MIDKDCVSVIIKGDARGPFFGPPRMHFAGRPHSFGFTYQPQESVSTKLIITGRRFLHTRTLLRSSHIVISKPFSPQVAILSVRPLSPVWPVQRCARARRCPFHSASCGRYGIKNRVGSFKRTNITVMSARTNEEVRESAFVCLSGRSNRAAVDFAVAAPAAGEGKFDARHR